MRQRMMFWLCVVSLLMIAAPARALRLLIITDSDSLGATAVDLADYEARFGRSSRVDSVLAKFTDLVDQIPEADLRQDIWTMNATNSWLIVFDLGGHLPPNWTGMTTADPTDGGTDCPSTFFQASFFLDPRVSDCAKQGAIVHEHQHVTDCIAGLVPPELYSIPVTDSLSQLRRDLAEYLFEVRGYLAQAQFACANGCGDERVIASTYCRHGLMAMRLALIDHLQFGSSPARRAFFDHAARNVSTSCSDTPGSIPLLSEVYRITARLP